jgi:hypothetical protein
MVGRVKQSGNVKQVFGDGSPVPDEPSLEDPF